MTAPRSSLAVLDALAPTHPVDSGRLARARAEVEWAILEGGESRLARRARTARRARRVVGATAAAFGLVAVFTVAPLVAPEHRGSAGHAPVGLPGAIADGLDCDLYNPVPGPVDPGNYVAPDQWSHLPGLDDVLFGLDGREPDGQWVSTSDRGCDTDPPVAVLYSPDLGRGITVYRDVEHRFEKVSVDRLLQGAGRTTVQGHEALYVTPPYGLHYMTWVDDDGVRWWVDANGMSMKTLVKTLDDIIDPSGIRAVPEGYRRAAVGTTDGGGLKYRWQQQYGSTFLQVTKPATTPLQAKASGQNDLVPTTFQGHDAIYQAQSQGGSALSWRVGDVSFWLIVPGADIDQIKAVAATIVPLGMPAP